MSQANAPRDAPPEETASSERPGQPAPGPCARHAERTSAGSNDGAVRPDRPTSLNRDEPSKDVADRGRASAPGADGEADPTRQDPHARQFGAGPQTGGRGGASGDPGRPSGMDGPAT